MLSKIEAGIVAVGDLMLDNTQGARTNKKPRDCGVFDDVSKVTHPRPGQGNAPAAKRSPPNSNLALFGAGGSRTDRLLGHSGEV